MFSSQTPSPREQQEIIQALCDMQLQGFDWRTLARGLNHNPDDIYGEGYTNPQKAEALVSHVVRHGICSMLILEIEQMKSKKIQLINSNGNSLDAFSALQLSQLCSTLFKKLDEINSATESDEVKISGDSEDFTEFTKKLKEKAKFSPTNRSIAIRVKNDNGVLKRKARKLGLEDPFTLLSDKLQNFYSKRILGNFPPNVYSADERLNKLMDELFDILPEEMKSKENIQNQLYGIIFDTTFQCLIFNE